MLLRESDRVPHPRLGPIRVVCGGRMHGDDSAPQGILGQPLG